MRRHRNPRPKVPKHPPVNNPQRRKRGERRPRTAYENWGARDRRDLAAAFRGLVRVNPRAAGAVLDVLQIVAHCDRRRSMAFLEAASMVVASIRGGS